MSPKPGIAFFVNGAEVVMAVPPSRRLLDVLREALGLTGVKEGCGNGECGACTVLIDGKPVVSCLTPVAEAAGRQVTTVEGLGGPDGALSPLQRAFVDGGGVQCGFCTPGMILSARALLDRNPTPSDGEIREALVGNLCRCTGYAQIVEAVKGAAKLEAAERAGRREVSRG